jgi:hypothetical protein
MTIKTFRRMEALLASTIEPHYAALSVPPATAIL